VVQDVFLTVFKGIGTFTKDGQPRAFRRWLYAITRYTVLNYWRKQRKAHMSASWIDEAPDSGPPPDDSSGSRPGPDPRTLLESVLSDWGAFCRLRIDKHSAEEVAKELGIPARELDLAMSRVEKRLREEDEDGVPVGILVLRGLLELIELKLGDRRFRAFRRVAVDGCSVEYVADELTREANELSKEVGSVPKKSISVGSVHTAISKVRTCVKQEFKALGLPLDEGKMAATDRAAVTQSEVTS
jgi:DNA-directed RNA polymerase specialized sigma24 family protein